MISFHGCFILYIKVYTSSKLNYRQPREVLYIKCIFSDPPSQPRPKGRLLPAVLAFYMFQREYFCDTLYLDYPARGWKVYFPATFVTRDSLRVCFRFTRSLLHEYKIISDYKSLMPPEFVGIFSR